jgi:glycosidase
LDNHDLSRFFSIVNEDRDKLKMAIGFMLTTRGTPSLYYGTEILMKNFTNPDALVREDFPGGWPKDTVNKFTPNGRNALESEMYNYIKTIANFRKNSTALTLGKLKQFIPQNGIYIYFRYSEDGEKVMVIMNQDTTERLIKPSRFEEIITVKNTGTDIVSKKSYTFDADILISPKSIVILEIK